MRRKSHGTYVKAMEEEQAEQEAAAAARKPKTFGEMMKQRYESAKCSSSQSHTRAVWDFLGT